MFQREWHLCEWFIPSLLNLIWLMAEDSTIIAAIAIQYEQMRCKCNIHTIHIICNVHHCQNCFPKPYLTKNALLVLDAPISSWEWCWLLSTTTCICPEEQRWQKMEKSVASSWKFSKRTRRYHVQSVKKEKRYSYFPFMVARVLKEYTLFQRNGNVFNPKQIWLHQQLAWKQHPLLRCPI